MALAVAAVNFAYFQRQDEPFREPFLGRLGFSTDIERLDKIFNPSVGRPVERAVEEWSGRRNPRTGPFRWVGLIREQAGLPKHRLAKFAEWLGKMRSEVGWANLAGFSERRVQELVAAGFVGSWYAREFLASAAGVEFIRSVCDDLVRFFDEGRLAREELAHLPFYRRGFMSDLVMELERQGAGTAKVREARGNRYDDPHFAFDRTLGELVLRFDYEEVLRGLIRCDQYRGTEIFEPAVCVGEQLPLRDGYTGWRSLPAGGREEWTASGWDPSEATAALFDLSGPLIWRMGDGRAVAQGDYLLITRESVTVPQQMVVAELTSLFIEGSSTALYRVREVHLGPGDRVESIDLRVGGLPKPPLFAAVGAEPWGSFASLDAVWQSGRARIKLINWTPENAARFHVTLRVGAQSVRLPVAPGGTAEIDLSHLPAPTIGTVYLEGIGRRSLAAESLRRILFAVWPPLRLERPKELLPEGEPATVELHLPSGVSFEPASTSRANPTPVTCVNVVAVQPPETVLRGTIRYCAAALVLHVPIRRARLRASNTPDRPLVLDPVALRLMHEAYLGGSLQFLRLWAMPGREVDLLLSSDDGRVAPVLLSKRVPPSGDTEIRPGEVKDALLQGSIAFGQFMVRDGSRVVPTETYYIDTDVYCRDELKQHSWASLPKPLATGLETIWRVQHNQALDGLDLSLVLPASLRARAAHCSYASSILDGRHPAGGTLSNLPQSARRRLRAVKGLLDRARWVRAASDTSARARSVLAKWNELGPIQTLRELDLLLPRWEQRLSAVGEDLRKLADVSGRLYRFRSMCVDDCVVADDVPRALLAAGRYYAKAEGDSSSTAKLRVSEAVQRFTSARQDLSAPWWDVAELLRALAVLRLCKVTEFVAIVDEMPDLQYGQGAQAQLRAMRANLRDGRCDPLPPHTSFDLATISPRTDDGRLAAALSRGAVASDAWLGAAEVCWIGAWLGWRASRTPANHRLEAEAFRDAVLRLAEKIPATADRARLVAEVRAGSPGEWT